VNTYFYYNADFGRQDTIGHVISAGLSFGFQEERLSAFPG